MKYNFFIFAINVLISIIYMIIKNEFYLIDFINSSFVIGTICFLVGLSCFVYENGFFNLTIYGFKKLKKITKKDPYETFEYENLEESLYKKNNTFFLTKNLIFTGGLISSVCIIASFMII